MALWISIYLPPSSHKLLPLQQAYSPADTTNQNAYCPLENIALALLQYTPKLALFDACALVLDVEASLSLFKGPRQLCERIRTTLNNVGASHARLGLAPTAMGAWLLARQTETSVRRVLCMPSLSSRLDCMPVFYLPSSHLFLDWLSSLGCTTLKHLKKLPRTGLSQRTSPQLVHELDLAYGRYPAHFDWFEAPDVFQAFSDLSFRTSSVPAVLGVAKDLIQQLCGWLEVRQWATSELIFAMHHEKGRHACPPTKVVLRTSIPSWHDQLFLDLLAQKLNYQTLQAPVIAIGLHDVQGQPRAVQTESLFPDPAQTQRQEHQLLDLLCARLGHQDVLLAHAQASYLPELASQWKPLESSRMDVPNAVSASPIERPFWLLNHAIPLETFSDQPCYQGYPLRLTHGPERIEGGWWTPEQHKQRDYFVATDPNLCRYWIYRERGTRYPGWFLHGHFA